MLRTAAWTSAALAGRRPRQGPLRQGVGAGRFQHSEWTALLGRFVHDGAVEYSSMVRVRRLVETYLHRLAELDPDSFIDSDDQLAFFLNAYNAIVVREVLVRYPIASLHTAPDAWLRLYPIGRHNASLATLHASIIRAFGDPRIYAALSNGAEDGPRLPSQAFTGAELQGQLDTSMCDWLADPMRGLRYDEATNILWCSPILLQWGGDFLRPDAMPLPWGIPAAWIRPHAVVEALRPWLPDSINRIMARKPVIRPLRVSGRLNEGTPAPPQRATRAV